MRRLVTGLLVLLVCATAHAEPKQRQTARIMAGTAAGVSGAVTLAGFLARPEGEAFNQPVLYTGIGLLMVAPSLGEFYAGQYLTYGMGIRAAATGLAIYALRTQVRAIRCDTIGATYDLNCTTFTENAYPLLGLSAIAFVGGVWYDVLDAADAVDRYNARHGYTVVPTVMPGPQGPTPGVMFGGSF